MVLLLFVASAAAFHLSGAIDYLTVESFQEHRSQLEDAVQRHYTPMVLLYMLTYVLTSALAIPVATALSFAGGFLFGTIPGMVYIDVAATVGAVLAFSLSRYVAGNWLQNRYRNQLERFNSEIELNGHLYLLTVRLIPVFPFFLINVLSGLTRIPLRTFTWTTAIGILPAALVYAFTGSQLANISSAGDILSGRMLAVFGLLALLTLSPVIWRKLRPSKGETGRL
jgi:uncharacterized membrane protein YdjX (TVP38/TMEM64 family)